jgi:hypothetical protein
MSYETIFSLNGLASGPNLAFTIKGDTRRRLTDIENAEEEAQPEEEETPAEEGETPEEEESPEEDEPVGASAKTY